MIGLIPRDAWEHNIGDLFDGLAGAFRPRKDIGTLYISGIGDCIPVLSGRTGLVSAIRALNLPAGARIGVPLYCCHVVFKAITTAGCEPVFIDIEPETFCLSPEDLSKKHSRLDAVIAVHMFGNLCDMNGIQLVAQGKPIIEDCAQSLGSKLGSRMAGTFGAIAFFSFRSGKYLSVGEGGALFSSDSCVLDRAAKFNAKMETPKLTEECLHVAKTYLKSILRSKPFYGAIGYALWQIANKRMDLSQRSVVALGQVYRSDLAVVRKRLPVLNSAIERQRTNADFLSGTLSLHPGMTCSEKPGAFYNRYHYPITFPSTEHRDFVASYLFSRQIDTIKYLDDVLDVATKNYGYSGGCPVAEELSKRVLIIPSYHSLRKDDLGRIAQCVNAAWSEIISRRANS